jgi:hypothetical protein
VSEVFPKERQFETRWHDRKPAYWYRKSAKRAPGDRAAPVVVRFDVEPGVEPSPAPPVRIFLGTEPEQYRAERVFIWSILQVRDPARAYEIHVMRDLQGYDRTGWKTGFTKYRYAIPALAGGQGRAIYNDVDQIYLSDPAELFDLDMGGAAMLGLTQRETSVMLLDCAAMSAYWKIEDAKAGRKHRYFRDITHANNLWGKLPAEWNARDAEFVAGRSKCFHFTTLQTQPWQPFPHQLNYRPHPNGEVWFALERAADEARYTVFTKAHPSPHFEAMVAQYRLLHERGEAELQLAAAETFDGHSLNKHVREIAKLVQRTGANTLLDYGAGKGGSYTPWPGEAVDGCVKANAAWPGVKVTCFDPGYAPFANAYATHFDGVISTDVVEHIPAEDIGWILNDIFAAADKFVFVVAACYPARKHLPDGSNAHCTVRTADWWYGQMQLAAQRYPGREWVLCAEHKTRLGKVRRHRAGPSGAVRGGVE